MSSKIVKKKAFKPSTKSIAHRLPQRKAKLRWNSCYLDDDEFDCEISFMFKESPEPPISPNRKRKTDPKSEMTATSVPVKKTRLHKIEKKSQKSKTHGKIQLRQVKKQAKADKVSRPKVTENECDSSVGIHTRSSSLCRVEGSGASRQEVSGVSHPEVSVADPVNIVSATDVVGDTTGSEYLSPNTDKKKSSTKITKKKMDKKQRLKLSSLIEKQRKIKVKVENSKGSKSRLSLSPSGKMRVKSRELGLNRKRPSANKRQKEDVAPKDVKIEPFPGPDEPARIVDVPSFYPTKEEFAHPIQYIQSISVVAEPYGMCKIIPPPSWKPDSKISEELRFTTQKQYIHKMYHRFGPNVCQLKAIQKHLDSHGVSEPIPVIGGVELDICKLSAVIEGLGGMQKVLQKKKLLKVSEIMGIPKSAQDRGTKLYDTYCKFLVSYDMLSADKKRKLEEEVKEARKHIRQLDEEEECVVKGKNMSVMMFNRAARNIGSSWLRDPSCTQENVEKDYWNILKRRKSHVVVHGAHIDTQAHNCSVLSSKKDSHYYSHPWNLNNLPHNTDSMLRYIGHVSGVTVPTLHLGMAFTTSCWSTDAHHLPYVQYLHSEADTIWYAVPESQMNFRAAMTSLVPTLVSDGPRWLREDTVMVPPADLTSKGVSVSHLVQKPGQFVVVFPHSYTATISCGHTLAESVHFATPSWLQSREASKILTDSCEPERFSVDELLCRIAEDPSSPLEFLASALPWLQKIIDTELVRRKQLYDAGLKSTKRMCTSGNLAQASTTHGRRSSGDVEEIITTCDASKEICYLSLVLNEAEDLAFSMEHGLVHVQKKRNIKSCKLIYRHSEEELQKILIDAKERLNTQDSSAVVGAPVEEGSNDNSSPRRKQARKVETKS